MIQNTINQPRKCDITILPQSEHKETVIWLHGFGDSPSGYLQVFGNESSNPFKPTTKIILLAAPIRKLEFLPSIPMSSWCHVKLFPTKVQSKEWYIANLQNFYDLNDIYEQQNIIYSIMDQEIKALNDDSTRLILGGFSQGAAISTFLAFNYPKLLGGIIILSSFQLPQSQLGDTSKQIQIFMRHGDQDTVIPLELFYYFHDEILLKAPLLNFKIIKNMGHEINAHILVELRTWFNQMF